MAVIRQVELEPKLVEPGLYGVRLIDGGQGSQHVSLIRGWMHPGASHSSHTHDVDEAIVFLSGRGVVELAGQTYDVGPGDVVHVPARTAHSSVNTGTEDLTFVAAFSGNLIASNPLQTDRADEPDIGFGSRVRHRLAWMLRRVAGRLARAG